MLEFVSCTDQCIVMAEHWPSWSFALTTVGVKNLKTIVGSNSALTRQELKATCVGDSLTSWVKLRQEWENFGAKGPRVFIQGSSQFVEDMLKMIDGRVTKSVSAMTPKSSGGELRLEGLSARREVSHKSQGGVTTGKWTLHSKFKVELPSNGVKRLLGHIVTPVESGRPLSSDDKAFTKTERIPSGVRNILVHVPSVFTRNNLVARQLTDRELMDAYDIEIPDQKLLKTFQEVNTSKLSRSYVKEAPLKVLMAATRALLFVEPEPDKEGTQEAGGVGKGLDSENDASSGIKLPEEVDNTESSNTQTGPDDVAAKNDDAVVDIIKWDRWSVDNFEGDPRGGISLVCKAGTYSPAHLRLFDALCALLLRRCRRNALCKHLKNKHGDGKLVPLEIPFRKLSRRMKKRQKDKLVCSSLLLRQEGLERIFGKGLRHASRTVMVPSWTMQNKSVKGVRKRRYGKSASEVNLELIKDVKVGSDAVSRLAGSSWWTWDAGSTLLFWRWPKRYQKSIRDGTPLFVHKGLLRAHFSRQRWPNDPIHKKLMGEKINKVRERGYILPGEAKLLTGFFAVSKGEGDIRIVYDATACGLNKALWAPSFFLPTIDSILRNADSGTWFGDIDLGEMFLNYFLDEEMRAWAGVDVREIGGAQWERWERTLMGFRPSPFICTQSFGWSEDCTRGDRKDKDNPLRWDLVILNLPGNDSYDPMKPWVYKFDSLNNRMAAFFGTYIDDIRTGASTERGCRSTTRRIAAWANYFGQQDAARKRRQPSRTPGAWAGAMCLSTDEGLFVTCTQKKWDKGKKIILKWLEKLEQGDTQILEHKSLEKDVGFLVHLSRTFPGMAPYLKGFYNTMNSWRMGRDEDGWKFSMSEWKTFLGMDESMRGADVDEERKKAVKGKQGAQPKLVSAVPRLLKDVKALAAMFEGDELAVRLVRGKSTRTARFGFGDASGAGFGISWLVDGAIKYRYGTWGPEMESSSSNLRELKNLVDTLELMGSKGDLNGVEMFLFTDNSTAESAFYSGGSSSETLFQLILRLRLLEMRVKCKIFLCHCSGTRMIEQGSDGLSRGNLSEGVMKGVSMGHYVPLHLNPLERSPALEDWLKSFMGSSTEVLEPADWFIRGHDLVEDKFELNSEGVKLPASKPGTFLWAPAPAAGEAAIEELRKARHKNQESTHVFVIPRLLSSFWRRHLWKGADLVVELPAGHPAWPKSMHEPLTLGFFLPYLKHSPWELRRSPIMLGFGKSLHRMWKTNEGAEGPVLREIWSLPSRLVANLSPHVASKLLQSKPRSTVQDSGTGKRRRCEMEEN